MEKHNFTLVEILIVIGIILLLVGITIGGLNHAAARGDEAKTLALVSQFGSALDAFYADYNYYPVQATAGQVDFTDDCWALFFNKSGHRNKRNKPYLEGFSGTETEILDAYGNSLYYQYPDNTDATTKFRLWSAGKDGANNNGGDDDIASWKKH
jgi:type II secretory pathway pseudopilin PulG